MFISSFNTGAFNIEAKDNMGSTPLYYACLCGHADLIAYLLANGAIPPKPASDKKRRWIYQNNHKMFKQNVTQFSCAHLLCISIDQNQIV